ncbi:MAG TPA: PstS family phosphate ABC transporter substrate-binding protein [Steroidobacteraceae bacterium]|nr:PstS family phosphate ABC transporter substrate-binding protein [Steroidobacteraceae bacterium]
MNRKIPLIAALVATALAGPAALAQTARDYISVVGSSTVYPFTTTVAEQFGRAGKFKTPKVESTGTGGGIKLFCAGVGVQHPDVANASRAIKASELEACGKAGVKEVIEVKVGYDGIVVANSKKGKPYRLTRQQLYLALAKQVPDPAAAGTLVANPYKTWNQIDKSLPAERIEVLGPPPTSGTRDAFLELVMEPGCQAYAWVKALKDVDEARFKRVCHSIREDGVYVEAGENDNLIVQKLEANPRALGIFGYSFLEENISQIQGAPIDGVVPTFENIASSKYPVSRPLFIYVKRQHVDVIPGLREFVAEYVSDRSVGQDGYLADRGLVPLPPAELAKVRAAVQAKLK